METITFESYLKTAKFYRDELDYYIAPVAKPVLDKDGQVISTLKGIAKYYKVMPFGYKGRCNGKDDYLRAVSNDEIKDWYEAGFGLAVVAKGWSEKFKKFQRVFDIDSFSGMSKEEFWKKYGDDLSFNFVTESFKGYHVFVLSDVEITITNFTIETSYGDVLTGQIRFGPQSGYTVEPPSLSVNDTKWILNGRYTIKNFVPADEISDLPKSWDITNFSRTKIGTKTIKADETVEVIRNMLEGKTKKGQGQGIYDINLQYVGSVIGKIKDIQDPDAVEKALNKVLAFNKKHTTGYPDDEIKDVFYSVLKKQIKKTKMDPVEVNMDTVKRAGGTVVQDNSDGCVYIQIDGKHNHPLKSLTSKRWVIQAIEPKDTAQLSNLLMRLDANIEKRVSLKYRVVRNSDNAICYSIGDIQGTVVTVKMGNWECAPSPDVCLFKPSSGGKEQVLPIRGGDINDIFDFVNINEELRPLFICLLVYYFVPDVQYPILALYGAKGSGKSTAASMLRALIDPNVAEFDTIDNKKIEDARVALSSSHLSVIDNISNISQEVSDLLCVLSTGGAHRKRSLYTDGDVHLSQIIKPLILTSVTQEIRREDLLSRTVLVEIQSLEEKQTFSSLQEQFKSKLPSILGAIFDILSKIEIKDVPKTGLIRMSDFHLYSRAISKVLGVEIDSLMESNFLIQEEEAIGNSDTGEAVRNFMSDKSVYEATSSEWVSVLSEIDQTFKKKQPVWFARDMRRLGETFKAIGLKVEFTRTADMKTIKVTGRTTDSFFESL